MAAGYSGTPLARKLSLKPGMRVWRCDMPDSVAREIAAQVPELELLESPSMPIDCAHVFVIARDDLQSRLDALRPLLGAHGFIWVSWPKKASRVATEITEESIREVCLPMGLVDVKVCAIDAVWSGLKLMVRRQ